MSCSVATDAVAVAADSADRGGSPTLLKATSITSVNLAVDFACDSSCLCFE